MSNIAIVVDSTAVVSKELIENNDNIYIAPLSIIFREKTYEDGTLSENDFFELVDTSEDLPTTSQPSIGLVRDLFEKLIKNYDHIIYITISSGISGTYDSGLMARSLVSEEKITVFDSKYTSIVQHEMAYVALNLIKDKKSVEDIIKILEEYRNNSQIILVVDDLMHLQRTGRLSATSAIIGNFLNIKPILHFNDGTLEVLKKVKTMKKVYQAIIEILSEENLSEKSHIAIAQAHGMEYAEELKTQLEEYYPNHKIKIESLSPVISVHTGPKVIGVGWINK